ncbi:MAG TPA: sensor histidine kinase N-terminal domain-containing protein [Burkholderiales bacterium]|nr:sensor histidine kinase N-terminal domain-containing protein [Burkholderiales bacterium]
MPIHEIGSVEQPLLRTQLLTWLLAPLFLLLTADTFISYWVALNFSQRAYDRTLVEIAREVSLYLKRADGGALALEMPAEARRLLLTDPVDRVYFQVEDAGGRVVAGFPIAPARRDAARRRPALYDGEAEGEAVRVVELALDADGATGRPAAVVRAAETMVKRNVLAREILLSVVIPQVLLILIAGVVVWAGVVRGLSPLQRLQRAVASRSHRDCSPVVVDNVPGEVSPLLHSINELLARLDRVLTLQSRFISDAAHQLKTPITALNAQFELAQREADPQRMRAAMQALSPALERLSRLVSQLLSLARNEPEAVRAVTLAQLDLNALSLEAATGWVPESRQRSIDLGFEGSAEPVMVRGDAARLRELLDNLLDNAIRYSPAGGRVTVRVSAKPVPTVAVNDDGPGIPAHERERVFERFHRLLGNSADGSGLGLAIAQEIARLHGADIALSDDTDGVGTTFSVRFPAPPPA